ncbi:DgyrCDS7847 [Dimorphilus gyrociliatus]|uniref:Katanin p80 WD40 repeat-containing subunit B1 n=1 Tax=Dimorphilus gyrociliatus TaxID=2664684 RepID=A0A7I8VU24_9ANNE|nr:DgyrCDS7847 [Dimorphilus gyrociliatus]
MHCALNGIELEQTIQTLSGHTSGVDCVQFNKTEELVAAGSASGCLKLWNLEQCKIVRTLNGHKSSIKSIEFHPCERFVLSGSTDSNIKLWDVERKGCIFTYRGHTNGINCVRFSPDGKWFCSGSDDSSAKIYDISSGKQIAQLATSAPVKAVEFHPNEFLLCLVSTDKTLTFWDIDVFKSIGSSQPSDTTTDYRCLKFHPAEKCVYAATNDYLKVHSWEPTEYLDSLKTGWGAISDMAFCQDRIVGVSMLGSNVSTYIVDQNTLRPFGASGRDTDRTEKGSSDKRRSFAKDEAFQRSNTPKEDKFEKEDFRTESQDSDKADIKNLNEYRAMFQPKKEERRPLTQGGVNPDDFLPKKVQSTELARSEIPITLNKGHNSMIGVLQARAKNLQIVRALWTTGNIRTSIETAVGMKDQSILVDILDVIIKKNSLWTLDLAVILLPHLLQLLQSKYENYAIVGLHSVKTILKCFGSVVKANVSAPPGAPGVDISREERHAKCKECYDLLCKVRHVIDSPQPPKHLIKSASKLKEVKFLFQQLD